MGCGVQKASAVPIQKVSPEEEDLAAASPEQLPLVQRTTEESRFSNISGLVRFTRKSEYVSYFNRDATRPSRNSEMAQAYRSLALQMVADTDGGTDRNYRTRAPSASLQLEYAYGYKCLGTTQNLFYAGNADTVVYPCGAVIVLLDKTSNSQKFLGGGDLREAVGHSDDVLALAISRNRSFLASGEIGTNPLICVWKVGEYARPLKTMEQGRNTGGVGKLAFSSDGKLLLALDIARSQRLRVFDWRSESELQFTDLLPTGCVMSCSWSPRGTTFCTVSPLCFWTKTAQRHYNKHFASLQGDADNTVMNAVDWFTTGNCVSGASNGALYLWAEYKPIKTVQVLAQGCAIHTLAIVSDCIVTGGEDNTVHLLDATFKEIRQVDVPSCPKSLDCTSDSILCGTRDGTIQEFRRNQRIVLMEAHSEGELWSVGLDSKDSRMLVSTGDDNKIKCWDLLQRRCVSTAIIEAALTPIDPEQLPPKSQQSRALCISSKGHIAVGHNNGHVTIRLSLSQLNNILAVLTDAEKWIQVLRYSPSAAYLAVGSHDTLIYIYDVSSNYTLFFKLRGHVAPIVSLDWSTDETLLKSCGQDGELVCWKVESETRMSLCDERVASENWATWTSATGWTVRGINQLVETSDFITCVSCSKDQRLVVVGNSWGLLELFPYPNGQGSKSNVYRAHSHEVANVLWTGRDELVTTGGCDLSIMQWRLVER